MATKIGVLIIHGVGSQRAGFSAELISELCNRVGASETRFEWQEIHWANILKQREDALWDAMTSAKDIHGRPLDLDWVGVRKFVLHNVGDGFAYHRDFRKGATAYDQIHDIVDAAVQGLNAKLNDANAPIIVMAHSLGAHIMSDYIWDRQQIATAGDRTEIPNLLAMITFGSNIPIFSLAYDLAEPINLPGKGIKRKELKAIAKWLNYFDRDDPLGWPMKPLYEQCLSKLKKAQKETVQRIEDYEINVGSFTTSWTPAAHSQYWTDNDFTKPVADYLKQVVAAVDA